MKFKQLSPWLLSAILIVVIYLASGYITFTYRISGQGIIYPEKEWVLARTTDGNLINSLRNNYNNTISQYSVTEFQRGDQASFQIFDHIFGKDKVQQGDTVGMIASVTEQGRLLELKGELDRQKKLLAFHASGEKPQQVQVAYDIMQRALQQYQIQKSISQRNSILFERGHIAEEEYEISENQYQISRQNYIIAQSEHEAMLSGAKAEQLDLISISIGALEDQLRHLEQLISSFTIRSPITGSIIKKQESNLGEETIIRIASLSSYLLLIPVEIYQLPYLKKGQGVEISTPQWGSPVQATIYDFDNSIQMLNQRQHVFVRAEIGPEAVKQLLPHMRVNVHIKSESVSLMEYIRRFANEVYNN